MCFRPTSTTLPLKCPECGFMNKPGSVKCMKCGLEFSEELINLTPDMDPAKPAAPSTPGALAGCPSMPGAPDAPGAPGDGSFGG